LNWIELLLFFSFLLGLCPVVCLYQSSSDIDVQLSRHLLGGLPGGLLVLGFCCFAQLAHLSCPILSTWSLQFRLHVLTHLANQLCYIPLLCHRSLFGLLKWLLLYFLKLSLVIVVSFIMQLSINHLIQLANVIKELSFPFHLLYHFRVFSQLFNELIFSFS
jgi:hypothetical protein